MLLNGATYEGAYFNEALNLPAPDALEEFRLITSNYSAEYGRNAGSVLNAIVKSGTNSFHGDLWEFLRNDALNSRNFFLNAPGAKVAKLDQNQFGLTGGGPAIKNRLFWFGSYQGFRISQQAISTIFVPTADDRNGLFTAQAGQKLIDPETHAPFPQNAQGQFVIPISQFNPIATHLISTYLPLPNGPNGELTQLGAASTSVNQYLVKGDFDITQENRFNFMWMRDRTTKVSPFGLSNVLNYNPESPYTHINLYVLNDTQPFRPNIINELRGAYVRLLNVLGCGPQKSANEYGINYTPDGAPQDPDFNVSGAFNMASAGLCNLSEGTPTREVSDTVTLIKGSHDFKMGADWFYNTNVLFADYLEEGNFQFNGAFTGNAIADFMLGDVSQYQRQTEADYATASTEWAGFLQDDWKVARKLTLNLGLRYFVQTPWVINSGGIAFSARDFGATWAPGFQTQRFETVPSDIIWPGDKGPEGIVPRGLYRTPLHNFEPRIGLAWDPHGDGRTAVRASYGIFHDIIVPDAVDQTGSVQPYVYREIFPAPPGGLTNPYLGQPDPWPYRAYQQSSPQFFPPAFASGLDINTRNAVIQSWMLDIEHQLTDNFLVDLAYAGKVTDGLIMITDANPANFIPGTNAQGQPLSTLANVNSRRPYAPTWASIRLVGSYGRASYHSLQISTQYRLRRGLSFQTAYTYSHSLDMNSNFNVAASWQEQTPFCLDCEKGNADFDLTHVLEASWVYNIPTAFSGIRGPAGSAARAILGNWELSGITRITSGFPFSCLAGTGHSLNGLNNDRCDTVGNWRLPSGRSTNAKVQEFFNTDAFVTNPIGTLGTSGRNFLRGPARHNIDLALMKNFPVMNDRYGRFQFRAEFFNAFNWVNFNNPVNVLSSPAFGRISSAGDPRLIQFALKYMW
ncbi:MAG TPA: hypothetical protein VKZ53_32240 [Candidatus Angelobacter sp.]|nr:hypothetical protein [Candidatus Angelobacter sp.]